MEGGKKGILNQQVKHNYISRKRNEGKYLQVGKSDIRELRAYFPL